MPTARNVSAKIVGTKLVIECELTPAIVRESPLSSTGKSRLLAQASWLAVAAAPIEGLSVSVNVTAPPDATIGTTAKSKRKVA